MKKNLLILFFALVLIVILSINKYVNASVTTDFKSLNTVIIKTVVGVILFLGNFLIAELYVKKHKEKLKETSDVRSN